MRFHCISWFCTFFFCARVRQIDPFLSFLFPSIVLISENIWSFLAVNSQLGREQKKHFDISFSKRVCYLHQFPSACSESLNSRSERILFFSWSSLTHKCPSITSSFYVWVKALADLSLRHLAGIALSCRKRSSPSCSLANCATTMNANQNYFHSSAPAVSSVKFIKTAFNW